MQLRVYFVIVLFLKLLFEQHHFGKDEHNMINDDLSKIYCLVISKFNSFSNIEIH